MIARGVGIGAGVSTAKNAKVMNSSVIKEAEGIISTDDIAKDILRVLHDNGIEPKSITEAEIMGQIMVLIARRDDKLTNYAYKMGRASA